LRPLDTVFEDPGGFRRLLGRVTYHQGGLFDDSIFEGGISAKTRFDEVVCR
jgi:hypothetical protein